VSKRIAVGIDGSPGAINALVWALDESARAAATVDVVHAWQPPMVVSAVGIPGRPWDITEYELHARQVIDDSIKTAEQACTRDFGPVTGLAVEGHTSAVLIDASRRADLLVVGSRGLGGFKGLLLGSVSQRCLHHASCPVVVVPVAWQPRSDSRSVIVGVDGSDESARALAVALEMARRRRATLVVVHTWSVPVAATYYSIELDEEEKEALTEQARASARRMLAELGDHSDVVVQVVGAQGAAAPTLLRYASSADVLVVGSRGHGSFTGMVLGSVSQQCAQHAPCPVVVVRSA
jgi:nucleotide-binding universal stress UspA family protein